MSTCAYRWGVMTAAFAFRAMASDTAPAPRVRVIDGRAGVYAATNASREAVGWIAPGAELAVRGACDDEAVWVCVDAPDNVAVWIYKELVRDGVVQADKSRIRSGAGLNYRAVGSLRKGERVEVRGTYGDWLKIRPPSELALWVLRSQVEPLAEMPPEGAMSETNGVIPIAAATPFPTNDMAAVAVTTATTQAARLPPVLISVPAELRGRALAEASDQGARVLMTGVLDFGTVGGVAAPFCLIARQADGDTRPVCHVFAQEAAASPHVGATVSVEGARWRVKDVDLPVVIADLVRAIE